MSHSHRDEPDLAEPVVEEPPPVVVTPPAPAVSNSEAERRAAQQRKAEGVHEQMTEHQFTGDLPDPSRGGTDTETRLIFQDETEAVDGVSSKPAAASRRGPPAPRALHAEDEGSWAAPPTLDALGGGALAGDTERWIASDRQRNDVATPATAALTRPWIRLPTGE